MSNGVYQMQLKDCRTQMPSDLPTKNILGELNQFAGHWNKKLTQNG